MTPHSDFLSNISRHRAETLSTTLTKKAAKELGLEMNCVPPPELQIIKPPDDRTVLRC